MKKNKIEYKYNPELIITKTNWKGNIVINGKFCNDAISVKSPIKDVLKWKLSTNPQKKEKEQDKFKLSVLPLKNIDKKKDQIIWLGHASFLITINEKTILTDPCFYDIPTAKRLAVLPCKIEQLKNIDYLLLSHDHRDHFDVKTLREIIKINPKIEILTTLNFKQLLVKNKINIKIQEAGWYQQYKTDNAVEVILLPSHHWGRRGLLDFNKVLWGGFLIKSKGETIYFSGDTAYNNTIFKGINKDLGKIDICILPIGAYSPSFIMSQSHTTPEEAFQIFKDLKGAQFIPMHYGTFDLSDEPLGEPIKRLKKCFANNKNQLKQLEIGEIHIVSS